MHAGNIFTIRRFPNTHAGADYFYLQSIEHVWVSFYILYLVWWFGELFKVEIILYMDFYFNCKFFLS